MSKIPYIPRYLAPTILQITRTFPVLLLTGARQGGKTTLLEHISAESAGLARRLVSLDEFEIRTLAKRDPALFLQQYPAPLTIDEIQYAPELLPYIKTAVDRDRTPGQYWLTGSQQFQMMRNVAESLAGRVGIVHLVGLSTAEAGKVPYREHPWIPGQKATGTHKPLELLALFEHIIRGSFPRLFHSTPPSLDTFYGSYVQTYIDRDLRDLVRVSSLASFEKFVRICAARTASVLNLSDLARDSDIAVSTAKEWLNLLQAVGQVFLLQPYHTNRIKRLIKSPKLYFLDTGLACYLTGWRNPDVTSRGAFAGPLFETFVVLEILKSYWHRGQEPMAFYYRTKEKYEVDLVIEREGKLLPIEIKLGSRVSAYDLRGIEHLARAGFPLGSGAVIAPVRESYPLREGIMVVPPTVIG